jgi:hypothetical protein
VAAEIVRGRGRQSFWHWGEGKASTGRSRCETRGLEILRLGTSQKAEDPMRAANMTGEVVFDRRKRI